MRNKIILVLAILCLNIFYSFSQPYQWAQGEGGVAEDRAQGIAVDNWGNVFVTGFFRSSATFGNFNFSSAGVEDIFVLKYDSTGDLIWAKKFGGTSIDIGYGIAIDDSGNCYVGGQFMGTCNFGIDTLQSSGIGDSEIFLMKLDSSGNVMWVKKAGSPDYDLARGISLHGNNLYLTGVISSIAMFDTISITSTGLQDVFLASYDLNGNAQWAIKGGSVGYDVGYGVDADEFGNVYVTGYFQNQASFGTSIINNASNIYVDVFLFKADSNGNVIWARRGGADGDDDAGRAITTDNAGNVYVTGDIRASGNFDSLTYSNVAIAEIFVAKYDSAGAIQYLKIAGGQGGDYAYGISAHDSSVFITGLFNGTASFGSSTLISDGSNDIYIAKLNAADGTFLNAIRAGGTGDDAGRAVASYYDDVVLQAGDFEHTPSTFTPLTLSTNGSHDIFSAKINFSSVTGIIAYSVENRFKVFPNPARSLVQIEIPESGNQFPLQLILYSNGSIIDTWQISSAGIHTFSVEHLSSGQYFGVAFDKYNKKTGTCIFIKE